MTKVPLRRLLNAVVRSKVTCMTILIHARATPNMMQQENVLAALQADAFDPEQWREQLQGAVGVVSCLGGFGSNDFMLKVCSHTVF